MSNQQGSNNHRGLSSYLKAIKSATSEKDLSKLKPPKASKKVSNNIQGMLFPVAVRRRRDSAKNAASTQQSFT